MKRYYEFLVEELFPLGISPQQQESLKPMALEDGDEVITELPEGLVMFWCAVELLAREAEEKVKEERARLSQVVADKVVKMLVDPALSAPGAIAIAVHDFLKSARPSVKMIAKLDLARSTRGLFWWEVSNLVGRFDDKLGVRTLPSGKVVVVERTKIASAE